MKIIMSTETPTSIGTAIHNDEDEEEDDIPLRDNELIDLSPNMGNLDDDDDTDDAVEM